MAERLSNDERCAGPGLAAYFVKGALDRGIALHTGVSAEELIHDGERVVGVRAKRDGRDLYVKARRGVIIGVSSYERDPSLAKTLGHQLDPVSMVMARSEEHTSELQSLMRISYAVFCLKKKKTTEPTSTDKK